VQRLTSPAPLSIKSLDQAGRLEGYASVFHVRDLHGDRVAPGAFRDSLARHAAQRSAPALLLGHDHAAPIGRWLSLAEDDVGLRVEGQLALELPEAQRAHTLLKSGSVDGLSVGMVLDPSDLAPLDTGGRLIRRAELVEVSLVACPANQAARVTSVKGARPAGPRELEQVLRAAGYSQREARAIVARGFHGLALDPEESRKSAELDELRELFRDLSTIPNL